MRARQVIAALDDLAAGPADPEGDQIESLEQLRQNLRANRGES